MLPVPFLKDKKVAVIGLGKSGTSAARSLVKSGSSIIGWDDNPEVRLSCNIDGMTIVDMMLYDLSELQLMVWSPGIPHRSHPIAIRARKMNIPLVCDIDLLIATNQNAKFIGVTGTNGKSTTTALIGHILKTAGLSAAIGGNLGTPALDLPQLSSDGTYILELSSYQLELLNTAKFDIGILLNITPDHLNRYNNMNDYAKTKASLFNHMRSDSISIISIDDAFSYKTFQNIHNTNIKLSLPISIKNQIQNGISVKENILIDNCDGLLKSVIDLRDLKHLQGLHNWQNACAAYATTRISGISDDIICDALKSYPGLAHRQEIIAVIDNITYINDSKATNADAVEKALICYSNIYWIVGGQIKEGGITNLAPLFSRIIKAFLIGESSDEFAITLNGKVPFKHCQTLDVAITMARIAAMSDAKSNAVILLSPACASWDQFTSFENRGDYFRKMVLSLPGKRGSI
ncbi:MAG: UDP-N-acetylmuramoyl-L-alanine--D-glutamate ligase [Rhodospirillaceae bacterium]|jgi:UDP-N-acetylmuramoylalanine--D-glutamate ligase|nr:UDP-N-acetylmuramoyl-L-alanine--D-glutamate ligase [Rhodospirillaceae bacterium]